MIDASKKFCQPVLFLIFNRPEPATRVFKAIAAIKPPRLYIASDGGRTPSEIQEVCDLRDEILKKIDWDCDVFCLFRSKNLGCKKAVQSAITWFFEKEARGIILEDDCLPSQSFFYFCQELLFEFEDDKRVFQISGFNKLGQWRSNEVDYFFSNLGGIWGWASWRDRWLQYSENYDGIEEFVKRNNFRNLLGRELGAVRERMLYYKGFKNNANSWAYPWAFARHKNSGLSCVPSVNLVENIGFGEHATHTKSKNGHSPLAAELDFPLQKPEFVIPDANYDRLFFKQKFFLFKVADKIKKIVRSYVGV
jgi:hypothetical protein